MINELSSGYQKFTGKEQNQKYVEKRSGEIDVNSMLQVQLELMEAAAQGRARWRKVAYGL